MAMTCRSSKLLLRHVVGASQASWSRCMNAMDTHSAAQDELEFKKLRNLSVICTLSKNFGATILSQSQHAAIISSSRNYSGVATSKSGDQDIPADCTNEIKDLYGKFMAEIEGNRTVPTLLVRNILENCSSPHDTELAFRVLHKYRVYRSSKARVKQNFNDNISALTVSACLRTECYDLGLKALREHNVYGLSPSLENAHLILNHAKHNKDTDLMMKTYNAMLKNSLIPTKQTADIMIRICRDKGEMDLMFSLAHEFLENGLKLSSSVFDIVISTAASFGSAENIHKAQKWREEAGLDHTIASVFAVAKAHLLEGKPLAGVDLIATHCQDKVKVNKYLSMLVRVWPSELFSKKNESPEEGFVAGLKENVVVFANALSKKFRGVRIDADEEFCKGSLNKKDDVVDDVPRFSAM